MSTPSMIQVLCYCVLAVMLQLNKWTYPYFTQYFIQFWVYYLDVNFVCIMSCWSTVMPVTPVRQCKYWFLLRMKNTTVVLLSIFTVCKLLLPKICQTQGLSQREIVQWPCPLIDRFSGLLRKTELFMGCSVGLKYAKNALAAGAPPRTSLWELTTLS